jgi:methionyl-tRNA formyltransferase
VRTVYLGTSDFAAAVLDRLAGGSHKPVLVVSRPDSRAGRGRSLTPPPVAARARELGLELIQPERLHDPEVLERIAAAEPDALCVCAYGVLIKEPLLTAYEILNVHPSLLPRWRGAAPVERAIMAGDEETGVSIMRLTEGLDSGPVCLREREPIRPDDDYATLSERLRALGGELLVRALDERPPFTEQDEAGVTYAHKIEARDRALDHTRPPEEVERVVRALRPHIGARLPLPDGTFLGVLAASVDGETLAPAGGRVRTDGERLLLDCNGGALELLEVQPPGGRPMAASDWLRGRPDPALVNFWLDPRLPGRSLDELSQLAISEWRSDAEWAPYLAALAWRGDETVLDAARELSQQDDPRARAAAAYVLGQLGLPERSLPGDSAAALEALEAREEDPEVLATIASAFGNLGSPHGTETLLRLRRHDDPRVREGAADALAGRDDEGVFDALVELTADPEPGIRDWATFALGTLSPHNTPVLRDALAARLDDTSDDTRIEAVHGLALRGDTRALGAVLDLLGEVGPHDDGGNAADTIWKRYALTQATVRLAALTGDARLKRHLPALDERLVGTSIEPELRRAYERVTDVDPA